jgi:predicted nucleotidyltransferase
MHGKTGVGRDEIVRTLVEALKPLDHVRAVWEGGAISFGRLDEMSDIDLYVDVEDARTGDVFPVVEAALEELSPLKLIHAVPLPQSNDYQHRFYRLENASEFLLVDVAVFKHSAQDKFLEPEIHGEAVFHFNKNESVMVPHLDPKKFVANLSERLKKIDDKLEMFRCFVQKEMRRNNYIEAMDLYNRLVLESLLEMVRIRYKPLHYNFRTHHILHDLPSEVVEKLKSLYFVKDEKDLERKFELAERWYRETLEAVDLERLAKTLVEGKVQ